MVKAVEPRFNREGDKTSPTSPTTSPNSPTSSKTTTKFSISRPVTPSERARNPPTLVDESWYWYKEQSETAKNLSEWLEALATAKPLPKLSIQTPPSTPPATAATPKQISWARIASTPVTSPKRSSLPLPTYKIIPKRVETASPTPPATSTPMLRKPQKPHLTIDDLVRMFAGKPRPFGLRQHQKRRPSPQKPGARPPTTYQSRITAYFPPAANQKAPIGQGLKSSKPKSFQQHTPAEPLPLYRPALPEKSAFSPYKKPGFSHTSLQSRSSILQSRSSFAWPLTSPPYFWPSHTSPPLLGSPPPDPHVCCTCFGRSSFRHDLFNYRRPSQQHPSNRRPIGGME